MIGFDMKRLKALVKSWKALFLYSFGSQDKAVKEFKECLLLDPKNGLNLRTLGKILIDKGDYSEGVETLIQALKYLSVRDKSRSEIFAYVAYAFSKLNRLDESINYYEKAINSWSRDNAFKKIDLLYNLGRILLEKREYAEAADIFRHALDLDDRDARIHFGLGIAYFERQQKESSLSHLEMAVKLDPALKDNETMKKLRKELVWKVSIH